MSRNLLKLYILLTTLVSVWSWSQQLLGPAFSSLSSTKLSVSIDIPQQKGIAASSYSDDALGSRRTMLTNMIAGASSLVFLSIATPPQPALAIATIDVNNALAREFTAFPGLYPTVATKIVNAAKNEPFKSKKDVYAILNEAEAERLRQYDKSIIIAKPDKSLQQFKTSQICKYECGSRTSNAYRDEQIKAVQAARNQ